MAVGIGLLGDNPYGWRIMSVLFGSLTLSGIYLLALVLFESPPLAIATTLITLFNQILFVQARIGMLDTFMFAFIIWALFGFALSLKHSTLSIELKSWVQIGRAPYRFSLLLTGIMLGLATACKWFGIIPWAAMIGFIVLVRLFQNWKTRFDPAAEEDWYRPDLWADLDIKDWLLYLGVIPVATYCLTFFPFVFIEGGISKLSDLTDMQFNMWGGQLRVVTAHPYMSDWPGWAVMARPIWYAFNKDAADSNWVRGVVLLGNPIIMWPGLLALVWCAWDWIQEKRWNAFFIVLFYLAFYGCWALIPRKIAFYYYYYPAAMMLGFALVYVLRHAKEWILWSYVGLTFLFFLYFYPILAALRIPSDSFRRWMWFRSWI